MTAPGWQKRRSDFNHDWLKNRFIPALAKWLNLLDDQLEDPDFEHSFVACVLPQWEQHRDEALALPRDFESQMSPRTLLGPRSEGWLGTLVHLLWLSRYPVRRWAEQALAAAREVEVEFRRLRERLTSCADTRAVVALRPMRPMFASFRERCQQLARAIEAFLSEVKAT
jgi:hypothetical protein